MPGWTLRLAAAHYALTVAAGAWALATFSPIQFAPARPDVAEQAFALLSWPVAPLMKSLAAFRVEHAGHLLVLAAALALNSLMWGALLAFALRLLRRS